MSGRTCRKCGEEIRDIAVFCDLCGAKQEIKRGGGKKSRGNGQGTIEKLPNGKYKAKITVSSRVDYVDGEKKYKISRRCKTFEKKKDAVAALATLGKEPGTAKKTPTFKELYDRWLPTHQASKSTLDCYRAAIRYFEPVWYSKIDDIDIDDLQDCVDSCGKGKRTQQNMKAVCGLVYKYGIPRNVIPNNLNLAQFMRVSGEGAAEREAFTTEQIEAIRARIGATPYADYIYCLIYLGYRPSEFLSLEISAYDKKERVFIHGAKTEAGRNRAVPISPKIQPLIDNIIGERTSGRVFSPQNGESWKSLKSFTEGAFYPVLEAAGIDNPVLTVAGGVPRHKYTPHSCRHTFATLLKCVDAPSVDKQKLIGHSSEEMLRYYQDVRLDDLRKIIDKI